MNQSLLQYISDGDLSTKLESVEYSTNLRSIVTIGYLQERYETVEVYEEVKK